MKFGQFNLKPSGSSGFDDFNIIKVVKFKVICNSMISRVGKFDDLIARRGYVKNDILKVVA